jgi:predicted amidophosphoribosyltransferase
MWKSRLRWPAALSRFAAGLESTVPFGRAVAYGSYAGGLRELIHLLKYNGVRPAASVLGRMLAEAFTALEPDLEQAAVRARACSSGPAFLVIPVPLYKSRRTGAWVQSGGTGGAGCAEGPFPAGVRLQLAPGLLQQIGLTIHQRQENVRGAFAVRRAQEVNGREVLLVDDVYTTGATVSECARVLRRAGATKVWVATVARTLKLASKYGEMTYGEMKPVVGVTTDAAETPLTKAVS